MLIEKSSFFFFHWVQRIFSSPFNPNKNRRAVSIISVSRVAVLDLDLIPTQNPSEPITISTPTNPIGCADEIFFRWLVAELGIIFKVTPAETASAVKPEIGAGAREQEPQAKRKKTETEAAEVRTEAELLLQFLIQQKLKNMQQQLQHLIKIYQVEFRKIQQLQQLIKKHHVEFRKLQQLTTNSWYNNN